MKDTKLENYLKDKLDTWYTNVKIDYNVSGKYRIKDENGRIEIVTEETQDAETTINEFVLDYKYFEYNAEEIFNLWIEQPDFKMIR